MAGHLPRLGLLLLTALPRTTATALLFLLRRAALDAPVAAVPCPLVTLVSAQLHLTALPHCGRSRWHFPVPPRVSSTAGEPPIGPADRFPSVLCFGDEEGDPGVRNE